MGSDKGIGKGISKNFSVVDYAIASPLLLPYFRKFEILDFDPIYSDVHCAVSFSIESIQNLDNSKADTEKLDDVAHNRLRCIKAWVVGYLICIYRKLSSLTFNIFSVTNFNESLHSGVF